MVEENIVRQYLAKGKNLMPISKTNTPIIKDWTNKIFGKRVLRHNGNVGWILGPEDLVLDVDPRNDGEIGFKKLLDELEIMGSTITCDPIVETARGGKHYYFKIPSLFINKKFHKTLKNKYPGVDFLTKGAFAAIPGCVTKHGKHQWYDDLLGGFEQYSPPNQLMEIFLINNNESDDELGDFKGLIGGDSSNWSKDKVLDMLERLDPSMGNDEWVRVGMALNDWDPIEGLPLWEEWSKNGDNYTEGETTKRWRSFDSGGGVTLGTISHMVKEVDFDDKLMEVNKYIERIKYANEKAIQFDLIPKIRKSGFDDLNNERLVKALQDRYKEIFGVKPAVAKIRSSVNGAIEGEIVSDDEKPKWCKDWVYVNSHDMYMNIKTLKTYRGSGFNLKNGKFVPKSESGHKVTAIKYVADKGFMSEVDSTAYLPTYNGLICDIDGNRIVNTFNHDSLPIAAKKYTKEGSEAIKLIEKHISIICGDSDNSEVFTQWLAHQVQYPGKKILWAPIIQSIQGIGKSFFSELLRACLGDTNVGVVSPTQVTSDFNGWATGVCVNCLEELRVRGHNRFDAVNALKPLITDRMIQINDKGIKQYMTYNTTNYICFTNYKDAIPVDQDDRRWWVIFVPITNLSELADIVDEPVRTYFPKIFDAINDNVSEIRKWLLEYDITEDFMNTKQAPMTVYKKAMIATEEMSTEGLYEIKELIKEGGSYYNDLVVSSADLFEDLMFKYPELEINTTKRNLILKKLGYMSAPDPIKVDGKTRRIWYKKPLSNKEIRLYLRSGHDLLENL